LKAAFQQKTVCQRAKLRYNNGYKATQMDNTMNAQDRLKMTRYIWTAAIMGMIVSSLFLAPFLKEAVIGIIFLSLVAATFTSGFIWNWGQLPMTTGEDHEKAKRERLDSVLRDLSDSQLQRLRERLSTGEITEEQLGYMLGDDGELVRRRR
jgi:hypothetical protein